MNLTGSALRCHPVGSTAKAELPVAAARCSGRRRARTMGGTGAQSIVRPDARLALPVPETGYLLCAKCGTYVGAIMEDEGRSIGIVNVNSLDIRDTFDPAPPLRVHDGENAERRRARRRKFWMKATLIA
jgi:hypothetical protein